MNTQYVTVSINERKVRKQPGAGQRKGSGGKKFAVKGNGIDPGILLFAALFLSILPFAQEWVFYS